MAAAEATLTEVLTEDAYAKLEASNEWLLGRCDEIIEQLRPALLHARASAPRAASSSPPSRCASTATT